MGRGILAGLVWGSVVGFGIVTVANQVVDKVYVSPVSLSSEPANEGAMPQDQAADSAGAVAPLSSETVSDQPINPDLPMTPDQPKTMTADAPRELAPQTGPQTGPETGAQAGPETTQTNPMEPAQTDGLQTAIGEGVFDAPQDLSPPAEDLIQTPDVAGETPVLGSPQSAELVQPDAESTPVQTDNPLPGQKPQPLGVSVTTDASDDTPGATPVAPKIEPQGQKTVGTKVGSFTDRQDRLKSTRLPSVSGSAMADAAPVISAQDLPAIVAFSADFTKTSAAPEMSVILVDIGALDPDAAQLANLPFPVTFAVDALAPGAALRAQMYRSAGLEVLSLIGLPDGASAQDVAVTIDQARDLVPVSIGFLDVPTASFQATRDIAAQVVASAAASGHGIVSFSSGLNALMQESQRAKQPAALVFRDFDGRDQNTSAIKRFLDQAAFRAGIDEDIVLVGRAKEDTVTALVEWSLGNRAATVELVPVSYLLTHGDAP